YTTERKPHVRSLTELTKRLGEDICLRDDKAAAARDARLEAEMERAGRVTNRQSLIPSLVSGMIDLDVQGQPVGPAGKNFFQPNVEREDGSSCFMDDAVSGFRIVVQDSSLPSGISSDDRAYWSSIGGSVVHSGTRSDGLAEGVICIRDLDGSLATYFNEQGFKAVVVRPDHYVYGAVSSTKDLGRMIGDIRQWLEAGRLG
ncbi:MAG: hypothetical protein O3A84_15290, partial [Proteobacteria bacterium]|nr:hypothetical protein [Pseudomonadota bacterium]